MEARSRRVPGYPGDDAKQSSGISCRIRGDLGGISMHTRRFEGEFLHRSSQKLQIYSRVKSVAFRRTTGKHLLSLIALSLKLDERFFETLGALDPPIGFVRLLHYPGELKVEDYDNYGASAHSDYGMVTLLVTDGVPGLQICRDKNRRPQLWEDVPHIEGAFIVNIGDMLERWTNCLFRSTLHRVVAIGKERYSVAFFLDPNSDCLVECFESCCSETFPPRFPPIRSGDYLKERLELTYSV